MGRQSISTGPRAAPVTTSCAWPCTRRPMSERGAPPCGHDATRWTQELETRGRGSSSGHPRTRRVGIVEPPGPDGRSRSGNRGGQPRDHGAEARRRPRDPHGAGRSTGGARERSWRRCAPSGARPAGRRRSLRSPKSCGNSEKFVRLSHGDRKRLRAYRKEVFMRSVSEVGSMRQELRPIGVAALLGLIGARLRDQVLIRFIGHGVKGAQL